MQDLENNIPDFTKNNREWMENLFQHLESMCIYDEQAYFKICKIKKTGFLVKIKGMYAYISFQRMPWQYKRDKYWTIASPTLLEKTFFCKITNTYKTEDGKYLIFLDAGVHIFRKVELIPDTGYTSVILQKFAWGVLIDVGVHFDWRYGSLIGLVHNKYFADADLFQQCEAGQILSVYYSHQTGKKTFFVEAGFYDMSIGYRDMLTSFVGKTIPVCIRKSPDNSVSLQFDNKYVVSLSRQKTMKIIQAEKQDGDIIECEALYYDSQKGLVVKWHRDKIDWSSAELRDYIGKVVSVNIYKSDSPSRFMIENKYPAKLHGKHAFKHNPPNTDVLECKVTGLNSTKMYFLVKPISPNTEHPTILDLLDDDTIRKLHQL
jgi:hypothetical protein